MHKKKFQNSKVVFCIFSAGILHIIQGRIRGSLSDTEKKTIFHRWILHIFDLGFPYNTRILHVKTKHVLQMKSRDVFR